ncbi:amidohydrolase family protein [Pseudomonas citronellolis]|jgi:predicted TIM-barrel fold metal-dependent hydrolase|uniref:amidohydrolase family protein n=1 Tax=Pseudomonas citronellolis TaxID=53408 RepID=UPI0009EEF7F1|nr:amidohydrolase family protein [Pseudomonas citronellolis]
MKRREFVAASGVVLGASILAGPDRFAGASEAGFPSVAPSSAGSAPVDESRAKVVDVHQHVIPDFYAAELEKRGMNVFAGAPLPAWSDRSALTYMDAQEVSSAILSLPAPAVCFGERKQAATLARRCNEFMAKAAQTHPARFGGFAAIPQREPGDACVEAVYALDQLGADGVQLLASDGQHFLGEPQFEELIAELDKRKAKVFVHPNMHATSQSLALGTPGYLVEFACDTTRAAVNLILSGTMERYPNISWILAEGGGCLPYVAWRVSLANALPEFDDVAPQGVLHYLKRFYFDTALCASPSVLATLNELVDPSHLLYGSDWPYLPNVGERDFQFIQTTELLTAPGREQLQRGNALSLFPRFARQDEMVAALPVYEVESSSHWALRQMKKPLSAIARSLKD